MTITRLFMRRTLSRGILTAAALVCSSMAYAAEQPGRDDVAHTTSLKDSNAQSQAEVHHQNELEVQAEPLPGAQPVASDNPEPADEMSEAKAQRLREQLLAFALEVSMRSDLSLGVESTAKVIEVLEAWSKKKDAEGDLFDAHKSLQSVYREFRAFLVKSYADVIPALRTLSIPSLQVDPEVSPELAVIGLFASAIIEIQKNNVVLKWCQERDAASRSAYSRIFPLLKRTAKGKLYTDHSVEITYGFVQDRGGVFLEARNVSGKTLTNVSLKIKLETLDGRSSDHYYFIPKWDQTRSGENSRGFFLLIAADWWPIGAAATTSAIVDLISDEIIIATLRCGIDTHIPTAAARIMDELDAQLKTRLRIKAILNRIDKIRNKLGQHPDLLKRAELLRKDALKLYNIALNVLDERIDKTRESIRELQKPQPKGRGRTRNDAMLKREQNTLKEQQNMRIRLVKGEDLVTDQSGIVRRPPR